MTRRLIPPPRRAEQPAPDTPPKRPGQFVAHCTVKIVAVRDFNAWVTHDALDRALARGIWP